MSKILDTKALVRNLEVPDIELLENAKSPMTKLDDLEALLNENKGNINIKEIVGIFLYLIENCYDGDPNYVTQESPYIFFSQVSSSLDNVPNILSGWKNTIIHYTSNLSEDITPPQTKIIHDKINNSFALILEEYDSKYGQPIYNYISYHNKEEIEEILRYFITYHNFGDCGDSYKL